MSSTATAADRAFREPTLERVVLLDLGAGFSATCIEARFVRLGSSIGVVVPSTLRYSGAHPRLQNLGKNFVFPGWTLLLVTRGSLDPAERQVRALVGAPGQSL